MNNSCCWNEDTNYIGTVSPVFETLPVPEHLVENGQK